MEEKEVSLLVTNDGSIIFAPEVIATIAGIAAADVDGIAGMSGGITDGIVELLGIKNYKKGVKVEIGTEETSIVASVVVKYGVIICDVCKLAQQAIKNAVETMTGLKVVDVTIVVSGVSFDDDKSKKATKAEQPKLK